MLCKAICLSMFFIFWVSTSTSVPFTKNRTSWLNENILTVLKNESSKASNILAKQPSIGFFSADLKFDGKNLIFCELGNGLYGIPLPSYSLINNKKELLYTPYWDLFWIYLKQFNMPIFYIGRDTTNGANTLSSIGGKIFKDIKEFRAFYAQSFEKTAILAYGGERNFAKINKLKKDFPEIVFVNNFDALFRRQKGRIHEFFNCEELKRFRPRWKSYPRAYSFDLAARIQADIPANSYIIKPDNGHSADGVVMVGKKELDSVLRSILGIGRSPLTPLQGIPSLTTPQKQDASLARSATEHLKIADWKKTSKQDTFIVEEYVQSKTVFYDGKPYDPTLRVAFAVYYDHGKIVANLFSCFWKRPSCSLSDNVSLTDKHITKTMVGCTEPGREVDVEDMKVLTQIFNAMIPVMYEKMLYNESLNGD